MKINHPLSKVVFILLAIIFIVFICLWAFRRFKTENYPLTISESDLDKIEFNCDPADIENKFGYTDFKIESSDGRVVLKYYCKFLWNTELLIPDARIIFDFSEKKLTSWTIDYVPKIGKKFTDINTLKKIIPIGYDAQNVIKILGYPSSGLSGVSDFPSEVIYTYTYTSKSTGFPKGDYSLVEINIHLKNNKVNKVKYTYMGKDLNDVLENGFLEKSY